MKGDGKHRKIRDGYLAVGVALIVFQIMGTVGKYISDGVIVNWVNSNDATLVMANVAGLIGSFIFAILGIICLIVAFKGKEVEDKTQ